MERAGTITCALHDARRSRGRIEPEINWPLAFSADSQLLPRHLPS